MSPSTQLFLKAIGLVAAFAFLGLCVWFESGDCKWLRKKKGNEASRRPECLKSTSASQSVGTPFAGRTPSALETDDQSSA